LDHGGYRRESFWAMGYQKVITIFGDGGIVDDEDLVKESIQRHTRTATTASFHSFWQNVMSFYIK